MKDNYINGFFDQIIEGSRGRLPCPNAAEGRGRGTRDFLDYIAGKQTSGELSDRLRREVEKAREHAEWRLDYMTLLEKYREKYEEGLEEGLEEGRKEGRKKGLEEGEAERKAGRREHTTQT